MHIVKYFALETGRQGTYYQRKIWFDHDILNSVYAGHINSFFHAFRKDRTRPNVTELRQFTRHDECESESYSHTTLPDVTVSDIRAFFDLIGYDYKTRKYASGESIKRFDPKTGKFV